MTYVLQNLISLQEASATGQQPTDETGTFYSPMTKLLSTVSNKITTEVSNCVKAG